MKNKKKCNLSMGNGNKIIIFLLLSFIILSAIPLPHASGESYTPTAELDNTGQITSKDYTLQDALDGNGTVETNTGMPAYSHGFVGWNKIFWGGGFEYTLYNTFMSFNTTIPADETIISSKLYTAFGGKAQPFNSSIFDFDVNIFTLEYGDTLNESDWNVTSTFMKTYFNTTAIPFLAHLGDPLWFSTDINATSVNTTGKTQIRLKSSLEQTNHTSGHIYAIVSNTSAPYLSITTITEYGVTVSYNFTAAGMTNRTVVQYPVEIIDRDVDELFRYEFQSLNQSYINFTIDANMTYLSITPYATVTAYGSGIYNITDTYPNSYYQIWFKRSKQALTTLFIQPYSEFKGEGLPFYLYKIYINNGTWYDPTTATQVINQYCTVNYSETYTLTALDYFGNQITNTTVIASELEQNVDFQIPIYQMNINNLMTSQIVDFRIWFNAAGNPYDDHVSPLKERSLAIRNGTYMFAFTYLTSLDNKTQSIGSTYWYNLTINGTHTINVGASDIEVIKTTTSGHTLTLQTLTTLTTPDVVWIGDIMPMVPVGGTRSMSEEISCASIQLHPYAILEATVRNTTTGTSGDFWDPTLSTGTNEIIDDTLTITAANYATNIMLNYTNGTNFANFTTNPGFVDLSDYTGSANFTFWANGTITVVRNTQFRNWAVFYWSFWPTTNMYRTSITLNNTSPYDWKNVYWLVSYVPKSEGGKEPDQDSTTVYDQNNTIYLTLGRHYTTSLSGVHMTFDRYNASTHRAFTFTYYAAENGTFNPTEILTVRSPYYTKQWYNEDYYMGSGSWQNSYSETFKGDLVIKLVDTGGQMDTNKVYVKDVTNDRVLDIDGDDYIVSGNTITINYKAVGDVAPGEARTYEVYFQLVDTEPSNWIFKPLFKLNGVALSYSSFILVFGIAMIVLGFGYTLYGSREKKGAFLIMVGVIFSILYGIIWMLFQMGIIG